MQPNSGSTAGASLASITGTGFQSGATVTIDGTSVAAMVHSATTITITMPAHAGGTVDVVVTNPIGQGFKVPGGYTYVVVPVVVTAVSPRVGSTGGGTTVTITGTAFHVGSTVTVDGVIPPYVYVSTSGTSIYLFTPAHTAGTVDIVVTNRDGQILRLPQVYTYAPPDSFDFNGDWRGFVDDPDSPNVVRFTIQNDVLVNVSLTCGSTSNLTFSPPPAVSNGEFSWVGSGGDMTGRILSAVEATGTVNIAPCLGTFWRAIRQ